MPIWTAENRPRQAKTMRRMAPATPPRLNMSSLMAAMRLSSV
jgi:hypothetical protein